MPKPRRADDRRTQRLVHFFRINSGRREDGQPVPYDIRAALNAVQLLAQDPADTYWKDSDEIWTLCWVDRTDRWPLHCRIASSRRTDFPRVDVNGQLRPLQVPANGGLAEETHLAFYQDGTVGALHNQHGPRAGRFAQYVRAKLEAPHHICEMENLIRSNVAAQLAQIQEIRVLDVEVRQSEAGILANLDESLFQLARASARVADAHRVRLVLRPSRRRDARLSDRVVQFVRNLARSPDMRDSVTRLAIKGYDRTSTAGIDIDLLKEYIVSKQEVVRVDNRSRALDQESAYEAIGRAHADRRNEIEEAGVLHLVRDYD